MRVRWIKKWELRHFYTENKEKLKKHKKILINKNNISPTTFKEKRKAEIKQHWEWIAKQKT